RQVERERAADPGVADQPDLSAEQTGDLAADREPEAGAAVLAAGGPVGLLEWLEDDPVLLRIDPDAGVRHPECHDRWRRTERAMVAGPPVPCKRDVQPHRAALGELERVGEQVLQHLLEALRIG